MERRQGIIVLSVAAILVLVSVTGVLMMGRPSSEPMDLRITYSNKVDYEPFIVAVEKGYFRDEGVNVTPFIVAGGIESAEAMITGSADLGAMGDAPSVILMSRDPSAKLLGRYAYGEGMHRMVAWTDITSVEELVGKKVGVQFGSATHGALLQLLEKHGLAASEVTLVPLKPSEMPDAMRTRQVDAMMGSEPWPTNVENACGDDVAEIADSSGLGSNYPMVLMATQKAVAEKTKALEAAVRAIERAVEFLNFNYTEAAALCAQKTGLSAADQVRCMDSLSYDLNTTDVDLASLNSTAQFLYDNDRIDAIPDVVAKLDRSVMAKVKEQT